MILLCFIHEWLTGFRWGPDPFSFIHIHLYQQCAPEDFSCAETYLVMFKIFQNPNGSKNGTFAKPWHNWVVSEILFAAFNTFGGWFGLNPSNDPAPVSNTVEVIWDYPLGPFTTNRVSPYTTECERDVATWLDMGKSPVKPEKTTRLLAPPKIPMIQPYQPDHLFP